MGGRTPSRIDSTPTIADSEPAAAIRWPTIDFGELAGASSAAAPSAARIARVSTTSLARVRRPVGADEVDLLGRRPGPLERERDRPSRLFARGLGRADVKRVGGEGAAGDRAVDARAAPRGVSRRLDDEHDRALAEHEPVPVGVERPAGALGLVVALGHRPHVREAREHGRGDAGIGAAGDDHVGLAGEDQAAGLEQ